MTNATLHIYRILLSIIIIAPITCRGNDNDWSYRRNSLCSIMIGHPEYKFNEELSKMYRSIPMPERFNDHNLGVRIVEFGFSDRKDQTDNINDFIAKVKLPQRLVNRWFGYNKSTGTFNMDLIRHRGAYDANLGDINLARKSLRGMALLEDAGEELIPNTYVMFNDIIYSSRSGAGSWLKMLGNTYIGNIDGAQSNMQDIGGFKVTIRSYLYKLNWNDSVAATFYQKFYTEDAGDTDKIKAYPHCDLFTLEYVGVTESSDTKTSFTGVKDPVAELRKILGRVIDKNLSDLMHAYPDFRIKAPLLSTDPLMADVGIKEGINDQTRFEVLEPEYNDEGRLYYKRQGIIRPIKGRIKDNRYMVDTQESAGVLLEATEFEIVSGRDFTPGMLIREL